MKNRRITIHIFLLCILVIFIFSGCNTTNNNFTGFSLQFIAKEYYPVGDPIAIQINEQNGSPELYNIYQKTDSTQYIHIQTIKKSAPKSFTLEFTEEGSFFVKVIPVLGGVERADYEEINLNVLEAWKFDLQDFHIKNNIIDLYHNVTGMPNSYNIDQDTDIAYVPEYASQEQRRLQYDLQSREDIVIQENAQREHILTATKYVEGQDPFILPIKARENTQIRKNIYFRINNSRTKKDLTRIFVGYTHKKFYVDEWISLQPMAYAGMEEAEGYIIAKKVGAGYQELSTQSAEVREVKHYGMKFYDIKATQTAEDYMELRIYAVKNGTKSNVYTDIDINLSQKPITPTTINLIAEHRTLLLNQEYTIAYTVSPNNAYDKSVYLEVLDDDDECIEINDDGAVKALAPTNNDITIKVISTSDSEIYAYFTVRVIDKNEDYFNLTHDNALTQTIGDITDIEFSIGTDVDSVEWQLDDETVGEGNSFVYSYKPDSQQFYSAHQQMITAKIHWDEEDIYIEREVTLNSLFDFDLHTSYAIGAQVDFAYDILLEDYNGANISVRWRILTKDGVVVTENAGNYYIFEQQNSYQIHALFTVNGSPLESKYSHFISIEDGLSHEIYNVNTNGYYDSFNNCYGPLITWSNLPFGTEVTLQIVKGNQTMEYSTLDTQYSDSFSSRGFMIPYSYCTLSDSFEYRIKTSLSNRYTPFFSYDANDIKNEHYELLKDIPSSICDCPNFLNGYITNVYDLSKLISYLQIFKGNDTVKLDLYFALDFEDIRADYEKFEEIAGDSNDAVISNVTKLIKAASSAYGIGHSLSMNIIKKSNDIVEVTFNDYEVLQPMLTQGGKNSATPKIIYDHQYPNTRGLNNEDFPICNNTDTVSVSTSNELFLAASWGMQPIPIADSPAELVYNKAKEVLNTIIDDSMSDTQKALAIYEYLCLEIRYDKELYDEYLNNTAENVETNKSFYLEGVFLDKTAVCDGISKAFVLLTAMENISSIRVSGKAANTNSTPQSHAWNMVMLEGSWHYVDATWGRMEFTKDNDDTEYIGINHYYFSTPEEDLSSHIAIGQIPLSSKQRIMYYFTDNQLYFENEETLDAMITSIEFADDLFLTFVLVYADANDDLIAYIQDKFSTYQQYGVVTYGNIVVVILYYA